MTMSNGVRRATSATDTWTSNHVRAAGNTWG